MGGGRVQEVGEDLDHSIDHLGPQLLIDLGVLQDGLEAGLKYDRESIKVLTSISAK